MDKPIIRKPAEKASPVVQPIDSASNKDNAVLEKVGDNWHVAVYSHPVGKQRAIAKMICSLPDKVQISYGRYFKTHKELSTHIRDLLVQEDLIKFANQAR